MLGGVHPELPAIEGGQSSAERTEPQSPFRILGDGHHREMGQTFGQLEGLEGLPVETAHSAVGRGDPQQPSAVLVDVLDQHAGQPVLEGVPAGRGVTERSR